MKIILHNQAKDALENFRVENNSGGVFADGGLFVWFKMVDSQFDCGECFSFEDALNKLKY